MSKTKMTQIKTSPRKTTIGAINVLKKRPHQQDYKTSSYNFTTNPPRQVDKELFRMAKTCLKSAKALDTHILGWTNLINDKITDCFFDPYQRYYYCFKREIDFKHEMRILRTRLGRFVLKLSKDNSQILQWYFFNGKRAKWIAKKLGKCDRTVFRYIDHAIEEFAQRMEAELEMTPENFLGILRQFSFIRYIYLDMGGVL